MVNRLQMLFSDSSLNWEMPFKFVRHELSPYVEYYQDFPEAFIMYMNEEPLRDPVKAHHFQDIVKFTLARYAIDFNHPLFHLDYVRKKFFLYMKKKHRERVQVQRLKEILENETTFKKYIDERVDQLNQFVNSEANEGKIYIFIQIIF